MKKLMLFIVVALNVTIVNAQWQQTSCTLFSGGYNYPIISIGTKIFVAAIGQGVLLSTDDGNNWTAINNGLTNYYVSSIAGTDSCLYAGTDVGIYLSTNNGGLWTQVNNGLTGTLRVNSIIINGNNVFALSTYNGNSQVYLSTNNGGLWTLVNNGLSGYIYSLAAKDSNIYALTDNGVYLSTNNGSSWFIITNGLPTGGSVISIAFKGTNIYAGTNNGMYLSENNGNSWILLNNSQNLHVISITISDTNIFVGTYHGVFLSTNNGNNWSEFNTGFSYDTTIYYIANNGAYIFASDTTNIWRRSLSDITPSCNASFTYQTDPNTGITAFNGYANTSDSATYPITYSWNYGDGSSATTNYDTISHLYYSTGHTACLTIQTANGCSSTFCDTINITPPSTCHAHFYSYPDSINVPPMTPFNFVDQSVPDSTSSIVSWFWNLGNGNSSNVQNPSANYITPGTYTVCLTITTSSGCSSTFCDTLIVPIISPPPINISLIPNNDSLPCGVCNGMVTSIVTGGVGPPYSFTWNDTLLGSAGGIFNLCAGTYTVTVTDAMLTTAVGTVTISQLTTLLAALTSQSPTTIGGNDGYIETSVSGGTPPFVYTWSTGQTTPSIYNLTSGLYLLNVTDANGCYNSFTAQLYEPYDTTGGPIVDTLTTGILDTCLNFVPDSFYISNVTIDSINNLVTVTWVFSGGGMTTSLTVVYQYYQSGNNAIVLTINCGGKALTSYMSFIHISASVGIESVGFNKQDILAYPVPFKDLLNIAFTSDKASKINLSLLDATGRIVANKSIEISAGVNSTELNTSNLPSGFYILNVDNNGQILRKSVVK